jgi:hypothetical protein
MAAYPVDALPSSNRGDATTGLTEKQAKERKQQHPLGHPNGRGERR